MFGCLWLPVCPVDGGAAWCYSPRTTLVFNSLFCLSFSLIFTWTSHYGSPKLDALFRVLREQVTCSSDDYCLLWRHLLCSDNWSWRMIWSGFDFLASVGREFPARFFKKTMCVLFVINRKHLKIRNVYLINKVYCWLPFLETICLITSASSKFPPPQPLNNRSKLL